jgi:hypothetical protein
MSDEIPSVADAAAVPVYQAPEGYRIAVYDDPERPVAYAVSVPVTDPQESLFAAGVALIVAVHRVINNITARSVVQAQVESRIASLRYVEPGNYTHGQFGVIEPRREDGIRVSSEPSATWWDGKLVLTQEGRRPYRPTIAIDFDGVIHRFSKGWQGGRIYDDPMPGVADSLASLAADYEIVVFTVRSDLAAVQRWLIQHGLAGWITDVTNAKPSAVAYIDDRAIRFRDWEQAVRDFYAAQVPRDGYAPLPGLDGGK